MHIRSKLPAAALASTLAVSGAAAGAAYQPAGPEGCLKQVSFNLPPDVWPTAASVADFTQHLAHDAIRFCHPTLSEVANGSKPDAHGSYFTDYRMYSTDGKQLSDVVMVTSRPAAARDSWDSVTQFTVEDFGEDGSPSYFASVTKGVQGIRGHGSDWLIEDDRFDASGKQTATTVDVLPDNSVLTQAEVKDPQQEAWGVLGYLGSYLLMTTVNN